MKTVILLLAFFIGLSAQAKVADFNSLIVENSKAQTELHTNLSENLELARIAAGKKVQEKYIVDRSEESINVPTSKTMLTFAKEKTRYKPSEEAQKKRLAEELSEAQ